jgi:hypothetical protein
MRLPWFILTVCIILSIAISEGIYLNTHENNDVHIVNSLPQDCNVGSRVLVQNNQSVVLFKCIAKWEQQ